LGRGSAGSVNNLYCPSDSAKTFATSYTIADVQTAPVCKIDAVNHVLK